MIGGAVEEEGEGEEEGEVWVWDRVCSPMEAEREEEGGGGQRSWVIGERKEGGK